MLRLLIFISCLILIVSAKPSMSAQDKGKFKKIEWDILLSENGKVEALIKKYQQQLYRLQDNDPNAADIYQSFQKQMDKLPPNKKLDKTKVKIPGFIAPLDLADEEVTELLLIPYFGQCIHSPPPPVNQTVLVKFKKGEGIPQKKSFMPIWVYGTIKIKRQNTDLAESGYEIDDGYYEYYEE